MKLGLSLLCYVLIAVVIAFQKAGLPEIVAAFVGVMLGVCGLYFYIQGNTALIEARGHNSTVVGAIIIVACICFSPLFFLMPLILFFGFPDQTGSKRRRHRSRFNVFR